MSSKLFLVLCFVTCIFATLEAASLRGTIDNNNAVVQKLDYEGVEANVRSARQSYREDDSSEDSDEDDEEDDAELQHQAAIRRQQAYEQSVGNSQEGSDEDSDDNFEEDEDDYFGRRLKREVSETASSNEIEINARPAEATENTSVLILIRDAIKKVTELSSSQQVANSAQQYFQLFGHFLQQTIKEVIGDDDDEDVYGVEVEYTTFVSEAEQASTTPASDESEKLLLTETSDKESSVVHDLPVPEKKPLEDSDVKA